jgi:hypothetical protein
LSGVPAGTELNVTTAAAGFAEISAMVGVGVGAAGEREGEVVEGVESGWVGVERADEVVEKAREWG